MRGSGQDGTDGAARRDPLLAPRLGPGRLAERALRSPAGMLLVAAGLLLAVAAGGWGSPAGDQESPPGSRFVCTSLPLEAAGTGCPLPPVPMQGGALPPEEELKATVLQLRETVLQQKETIGSQREAIRELTGKLSRCEGTDGKSAAGAWKNEVGKGKDTMGDLPRDPAQVIDQLSRTMQTLKDRLESLEVGPGSGAASRPAGTASSALNPCGDRSKLAQPRGRAARFGLPYSLGYLSPLFNGKNPQGASLECVLPLPEGRLWFPCLSPA